jgi:hypothetical protein
MAEKFWEYLGIMAMSGFKFVPGVALSVAAKHSFWEQVLVTFIGGSFGVSFFGLFGGIIRDLIVKIKRRRTLKRGLDPDNQPPQKPSKLATFVWTRFGLIGIAFFTPPIFSPPIGTAIALAFGAEKFRMIFFMVLSMAFWALVFGFLGEQVVSLLQDS